MIRILFLIIIGFSTLVLGCALFQRKLLYYPSHHHESNGLAEWQDNGQLIGYAREVPLPANVWLMLHGNGGQASDRAYAISSFSSRDSVFILEYPGYGLRPGAPSRETFNCAARQGYELLRKRFPDKPICVAAESIGSGPASVLTALPQPPAKLVLVVPFDILARVASHHFPFLPARLLLDNWNNIEALQSYQGSVEIFVARNDRIIPPGHARALAAAKPGALLHEIDGGHNDWADNGRVMIRNP